LPGQLSTKVRAVLTSSTVVDSFLFRSLLPALFQ
jgi:hypothetical protein